MSAFPAGYRFHRLAQVSSTNIHAMECLYAGLAAHGDVFFTDFQSQGKGQRGKSWQSGANDSILMSLVLDTSRLSGSQSFRLSATIALAAADFLQGLVKEKVFIKWPNDLYIGDRKAGGILIENIVKNGGWKWSVVGIGININQQSFPAELPNAVSVFMISGANYSCEALLQQLTGTIDQRWQQLNSGGWMNILTGYNVKLYGKGSIKRLRRGTVVIPCMIRQVNGHGILVAGENDEWQFSHGEVEWLMD